MLELVIYVQQVVKYVQHLEPNHHINIVVHNVLLEIIKIKVEIVKVVHMHVKHVNLNM